jgi:hypothetical protein
MPRLVKLRVESAYHLRLDRDTPEATYLIGLRIIEPAGEDLTRFKQYLSTLKQFEEG